MRAQAGWWRELGRARGASLGCYAGHAGEKGKKEKLGRAKIVGLKTFSFFFSQNQTNKFNSNSNSKI